ncbi:MAG: DUF4956 domain-containing protein [Clostridia bacterium]|nr:DUF4956 domain-containing protein [Clostridia bacterium]
MFYNVLTNGMNVYGVLACISTAVLLGLIISLTYINSGEQHTKSMAVSLVLLPALVGIVIMMVNGNLGTGVAVVGAFSLVRFRSVPGSSKEICSIFFAMAVGLACGVGYIGFAAVVTLLICVVLLILAKTNFAGDTVGKKELKIVIPENLNYTHVFDDIFQKFTKSSTLLKVKTTNMGSMFELYYEIELLDEQKEKEFIDEIRCRNGNLTVMCCRQRTSREEL